MKMAKNRPTCPPFPCDCCESEPCSGNSWNDCDSDPSSPCGRCIKPCSQTPCKRNPGPEAFDEFEACLNGSSFIMRVCKDGQRAENVSDCTQDFNDENDNTQKSDCSFTNIQRSNSARNHKHHTDGHNINYPISTKTHAVTKYSGNDNCHPDSYNVPYSKIKTFCGNQSNKIDNNRNHRTTRKCNLHESDSICQPKHRKGDKVCCVQLDHQDTHNFMKGFNGDSHKKRVEVCYKSCEDADRDVFLLKLGTKHKSDYKKNNIEIELKTPKLPVTLPKQQPTRGTQITETELDIAMSDGCKGKKGKGKKGKKK